MILFLLCVLCVGCAVIPLGLFLVNLACYRPIRPRPFPVDPNELVSVVVPARNEEKNIGALLESILANRGVRFEVLVLDDQSEDATATIVRAYAARDHRVRLLSSLALPRGWCGKQHACHLAAQAATGPLLLFLDADVRLQPDALCRLAGFIQRTGADLVSGVPRQELITFSERLLLPLIHFVLLGFLPMFWMRRTRSPAFAAGCGQLLLVRATAYHQAGGHAAIRESLHDGLQLPRLFRRTGFRTELFDATDLASCRMYQSNPDVWRGLAKNAVEGLASLPGLAPITLFLVAGQVLPLLLLASSQGRSHYGPALGLALAGVYLPRALAAWRFKQSPWFVFLHPIAVMAFIGIQWYALARQRLGRPAVWKDRAYGGAPAPKQTFARSRPAFFHAGLLCAGLIWAVSAAENQRTSESGRSSAATIASFDLEDQYGNRRQIHFPRAKPTVVAIADRKGNPSVDAWVRPVVERFGSAVDILGIADLSTVPSWLKGTVRKRFTEARSYPVMLDWTGAVTRTFGTDRDHVEIYVVDGTGRLQWRRSGPVNEEKAKELLAALQTLQPPKPGPDNDK